MRGFWAFLLVFTSAAVADATPLAMSYSVTNSGLFESFDQMGTTGTRAPGLPNGAAWDSFWSLTLQGATPVEQYTSLSLPVAIPPIDAYNAGSAGSTDRALGLYTTSNSNPTRDMTARFQNDTGAALSSFHLNFDVEFWIQAQPSRWGGIQAFYSPNGTTWTNLGNAFEATLVNSTNSAGFVDGNAAANSVRMVGGLVDFSTYGLAPLPAGSTFYLRFSSSTGLTVPTAMSINQNRQVGAFMDNLWVGPVARPPAVPEASTSAMLALGLGGLAWRGRKRTPKRPRSA
jgi:PEP-CTERM motif